MCLLECRPENSHKHFIIYFKMEKRQVKAIRKGREKVHCVSIKCKPMYGRKLNKDYHVDKHHGGDDSTIVDCSGDTCYKCTMY